MPKPETSRSSRKSLLMAVLIAFTLGAALASFGLHATTGSLKRSLTTNDARQPETYRELLALQPSALAPCDIARVNLLCAEGLPGADGLNITAYLATLDTWANRVRAETERNFHRFRANPAEYENSEAFYRMGMLITVVQQDFGVRYNPKRIESPNAPSPNEVFFADSRDCFLHGILSDRRMGTCVSMPVLYVAVARRLGYPVKLVTTKAHLFCRWESPDGREKKNIDGAGHGISSYPDDYYRRWPMPVSDAEVQACGYLQSLTPEQDLAVFLSTRGECLKAAGRLPEARVAFAQAHALVPRSPEFAYYLTTSVNGLMVQLAPQLPSTAPRVLSHAEIDAMAAEVEAINRHNREMMERRSRSPQPGVPTAPTVGTAPRR